MRSRGGGNSEWDKAHVCGNLEQRVSDGRFCVCSLVWKISSTSDSRGTVPFSSVIMYPVIILKVPCGVFWQRVPDLSNSDVLVLELCESTVGMRS